jgi:hypothetical protein
MSGSIKGGEVLDRLGEYYVLKNVLATWRCSGNKIFESLLKFKYL